VGETPADVSEMLRFQPGLVPVILSTSTHCHALVIAETQVKPSHGSVSLVDDMHVKTHPGRQKRDVGEPALKRVSSTDEPCCNNTNLPCRVGAIFVFLLSGFAALVYQVAWQRMLVVFAGGDIQSVTLIVTAFMLGLSFGNLAGGWLADRSSATTCMMLFGTAELLIGLFGFASKWLYYDVLYLGFGNLAGSRVLTAVALAISLLLPTVLMGLSLPLLARALTRELPHASSIIGKLYGVNALGAALGAICATWILAPQYGLEGGVKVAAWVNVLCAAGTIPLVKLMRNEQFIGLNAHRQLPASPVHDLAVANSASSLRGAWYAIYAVSGFMALSLEIVWFRLLGVMLKSTAFTFGTLLGIYLAGLAVGSLAGARIVNRSRQPAAIFLILQGAIGLYSGLMTAGLLALVQHWNFARPLWNYFDGYEPIDPNSALAALGKLFLGTATREEGAAAWLFLVLYLGLPLLLVAIPTFLMGLSFPYLQRAVQTDLSWIGRRVGWLQTANIVGCLLGAVVTGMFALAVLGTAWTLKLIVAASAFFAIAGVRLVYGIKTQSAIGLQIAMVAAALICVWMLPNSALLWARVHGTSPNLVVVGEDGSGVSVLKDVKATSPHGVETSVFVNGLGQSWIPYATVHTALGALPAMLHPAPRDVAVIGLGSGDSLFSIGGRPETQRIDCIEIVGAQIETLRHYAATNRNPALVAMLADPRIRHVTGDGRLYLMQSQARFDIIEADALRPNSAHSGTLYSEGYFQLLRSRLKPGGFAVTWSPTQRVHDTFVRVFPYVLSYGHIVIGSSDPITVDAAAVRARFDSSSVRNYYERGKVDVLKVLYPYLGPGARAWLLDPNFNRSQLTNFNTDVFPKDEFELRALWGE
jgi:spermidine synthase